MATGTADLVSFLTQVLRHCRRGVFGELIATVCPGATRVRIRPLRADRKVLQEGADLWLDGPALQGLRRVAVNEMEERAAVALYFLHELLHLPQGMAEKATVRALRRSGAELVMMAIDLAADHASAHLLAECTPRFTVLWLKELQGRLLSAFPVGPNHRGGARRRKARRLAALRLELQGRRLGVLADEGLAGGHLWPELAAEGPLLLLRHGPVLPRVVLEVPWLSREEAWAMEEAADPRSGIRLADLDSLCLSLLSRGAAPPCR